MLNIHIYGFLKKKFDINAKLSEATILQVDSKKNETFADFLKRMKIDKSEIGDCFVNGKIANDNTLIPKDARIGLFSTGMCLLDGGQHIKGHGFVTKPSPVPLNTWNT